MIITRDDSTWVYTVTEDDGSNPRKLPSVTTVIDQALNQFAGFTPAMMERVKNAGEFGRAVHTLTELDDAGTLDEENLDPGLLPILQAWEKFKFDSPFSFIRAEYPIASKLGYAGTLDRIAEKHNGSKILLEIKSRQYLDGRDGLQTIAYAKAYEEMTGEKIKQRYIIELKRDGTYTLTENRDQQDWNIFRSMLAIYNWRKNHGI
jgi:hypothetical protein